jgi:alpha-beta hydrolase superfamily lysophospholipase
VSTSSPHPPPITGGLVHLPASDGVSLALLECPAEGPSAAILVHGIASHQGWYGGLARGLAGEGISTYVPDRRGVGRSTGTPGHMNAWRRVVEDIMTVRGHVEKRHPGRPIHLIGISLGAMFSTAAALIHPGAFAGLIMSAPAFASTIRIPLTRRLGVLRRALVDPTHLYDLPFGPEEITHPGPWRDAILDDPLRTRAVSARFFLQMIRLQGFVRRHVPELRIPTCALLAGDDRVIDNPAVRRILLRAASSELHIETFVGAPHILPSALPRNLLLERILPWLHGNPPEGRCVLTSPIPVGEIPGPPKLSGP